MLKVSAHSPLTVRHFSCYCNFIFVSFPNHHFKLHNFAFISVTFMFAVVAASCAHFNKWCFHVIFALECVSFNLFGFCKCHFCIFLLSLVFLLDTFTPLYVTPLHITRGISSAHFYIRWYYLSLGYRLETLLQLSTLYVHSRHLWHNLCSKCYNVLTITLRNKLCFPIISSCDFCSWALHIFLACIEGIYVCDWCLSHVLILFPLLLYWSHTQLFWSSSWSYFLVQVMKF